MHLWTEYEGRTIAGAYTLGKLLRSEGRNGFFATSKTDGNAAIIRLTEAHFDEDEVLKRWRQVAELHGGNLIEIERVGKTDFDGVALTYALMERNDANLEDVLKERPLTTAETSEVAKSVLAALTTLHGSGLVHEHVEPANVMAVGDRVKLRSDCVRECVADGEFTSEESCEELRKRDIHDFGVLLLRCLTLEREWTPSLRLPEPFKRIVPAAIDGHMSLRQMDTVLNPPAPSAAAAAYPAEPVVAAPSASAARPPARRAPLVPEGVRPAQATAASAEAISTSPVGSQRAGLPEGEVQEAAQPVRSSRERYPLREQNEPGNPAFKPVWLLAAVAGLALVLLAWHLFNRKSGAPVMAPHTPAAASTAPAASDAEPAVVGAPPAGSGTAASGSAAPGSAAPAGDAPSAATPHSAGGKGWYVIAYTYNREDQARAKAVRVARRDRGFHPEVFCPSGHAPYLVSLGGPLSETEAEALEHRARHSGLPRDTFIRRY